MDFDRRYAQLNQRQKQAVDHIDGPVMVIAGPGTGKTELLSIRAANILKQTDTLPENILCLTFTDSGAAAMRERLVGIIGKDAYKVAIHTFHSFGTDIISKYREYFYNNALFSPADELAQYNILKSIFEELDHNNPLSATMNGEFTYLSDARSVISELKRAGGMTSDELLAIIQQDEASIDEIEGLLIPIVADRVSKKMFAPLTEALRSVQDIAAKTPSLYEVTPLAHSIAIALEQALTQATEEDSTKPLSTWKAEWLGKNSQKQSVFKNRERLSKLKALSYIYYEYLRRMEAASLYDYDDMILQVVHALGVHDDLRATLQEQYLYLMVDEFQDTNVAQMRILHSLTDSPVHEGEPNILTVGDDDQAVYGFQGADVSNMLHFRDTYPTAKLIVLTDNYRSIAPILSASRDMITQGADRLETYIPEIDKNLTAHKPEEGGVELIEHASIHAERYATAQAIKAELQEYPQRRIAILARKHADLQAMLPYLSHAEVPVSYEKQDNALDQPPIIALELLARTVVALAVGRHDRVNALLPELLAHPAWGVATHDLWKLSLDAFNTKQHWMEIMATTPAFTAIHAQLTEYAAASLTKNISEILDILIGRTEAASSPLFDYFFSAETLEKNPEQYLDHLGALRAIRRQVEQYKNESSATLATLLDVIDTYRSLGLVISAPRQHKTSTDTTVELLTAHKSKGLEYDHVYILHSIDSRWGQSARVRSRSIQYPQNLPLAPAGDTADERLRLFYVAMTRAKQHLTLSYAAVDEKEKASLAADFIAASSLHPVIAPEQTIQQHIETQEIAWSERLSQVSTDLKTLLAPRLSTYRLSATAFTSFLDVTRGGPRAFLLDSLLSFPRSGSTALSYGNAIHYALQQAHTHVIARGEEKPLEDILHDFEQALTKERLTKDEHAALLQKGSDHLPTFIKAPQVAFLPTQKAELAFAHQEVNVEGARLTGKIDLATFDTSTKEITLTDYKTGKPALNWQGSGEYEKMKLHHYKQQLLFYKLLVEHSRDYSTYTARSGSLAFVQPTKEGAISIIDTVFSADEVDRMKQLISAVWKRIISLDLPDTSTYPDTLKGILAFEQDLIDEKI